MKSLRILAEVVSEDWEAMLQYLENERKKLSVVYRRKPPIGSGIISAVKRAY